MERYLGVYNFTDFADSSTSANYLELGKAMCAGQTGEESDWKYTQQKTVLQPGSALLLYTDGLTEATRSDGTLFGEDRVIANLTGLDAQTSKDLSNHIKAAVEEFVGEAEQSDDITMLVIKKLQ